MDGEFDALLTNNTWRLVPLVQAEIDTYIKAERFTVI
jgi:hypothetical protein